MKNLLLLLAFAAAASGAAAKIVTKPVAYEHAGVKLEGYLAYDDTKASGAAKAPGVLVIPEWWGLTDYPKSRAEQLAKLGYVAFAADMYGAGVVTGDPKKAGELAGQFYGKPLMAERARAGLDQLLKTGLVDASRVAAIGYCFGGATCQALAYSGAPLAGIVSFHGSLIPASPEAATANRAKFLVCHGAV
ncbi:MAG: dienelactone hydrolase family protein, partial [Verrucomicrobia bacterium]|nr:dienelactone hydrolase family protein [Verrucomicrobiota bacterium]